MTHFERAFGSLLTEFDKRRPDRRQHALLLHLTLQNVLRRHSIEAALRRLTDFYSQDITEADRVNKE